MSIWKKRTRLHCGWKDTWGFLTELSWNSQRSLHTDVYCGARHLSPRREAAGHHWWTEERVRKVHCRGERGISQLWITELWPLRADGWTWRWASHTRPRQGLQVSLYKPYKMLPSAPLHAPRVHLTLPASAVTPHWLRGIAAAQHSLIFWPTLIPGCPLVTGSAPSSKGLFGTEHQLNGLLLSCLPGTPFPVSSWLPTWPVNCLFCS